MVIVIVVVTATSVLLSLLWGPSLYVYKYSPDCVASGRWLFLVLFLEALFAILLVLVGEYLHIVSNPLGYILASVVVSSILGAAVLRYVSPPH